MPSEPSSEAPVEGRPESMARGAALVTVASALFVLSGYAVNVWLGRLLGPADYGRFGVVLALITIINTLQNASVPQAVARHIAIHPDAAAVLLRRGMNLQVGIGVTLAIGLAVTAPVIASALSDVALTDPLRAAALVVPPYGVYALLIAYHNGRRTYTRQAISQAAYAIGKAVAVVMLTYPMRLTGAILGYAVAAAIGLASSAMRLQSGGPRAAGIWPLLRLAAPLSVYALASVAQLNVDILFVKGVSPRDADAGLYAAAQSIARIPYYLMGGLAVLVLPALAAIAAQDARAGARAAGQALRMAILVAVPVAAIAAGGAPGMLDLLFGSDYTSGWPVLSILAIGMAALAISSVAAGSLSGIGQPGWSAAIAVIGLAIALFLCIVLVPALGPPGAAMATTASTAVALALLLAKLEASLPGSLPWLSILRITGIAAVLGGGLAILDARGLALIGACVVASVISVGILVVSGEVGGSDVRRLRAGLRR